MTDTQKTGGNLVSKLLRAFLALVAIPLLGLIALTCWWFFTKASASDFIPASAMVRANIPSVKQLYEGTIDSKAVDAVLDSLGLTNAWDSSLEFRSALAKAGPLAMEVINVPIDVVVLKDKSTLIIVDLQIRSVLLQLFPVIQGVLPLHGIRIGRIPEADEVLWTISPVDGGDDWYVWYNGGIIVASPARAGIREAIKARKNPQERAGKDLERVFLTLSNNPEIKISFRAAELVSAIAETPGLLAILFKDLTISPLGALGLTLKKSGLSLEARLAFNTGSANLQQVFSPNGELNLLKMASSKSSLFSSVRVSSIEDLYKLLHQSMPQDIPALSTFDATSQTIFGKSAADLLYAWPGKEFAIAYLEGHEDPIYFIELKNRQVFDSFLATLGGTIFLDVDDSLVLNGSRLQQIKMPEIWKIVSSWFTQEFDFPWFVVRDNVLVLSSNAQTLSAWSESLEKDGSLLKSSMFASLANAETREADVLLWFDGKVFQPKFLRGIPYIRTLFSHYRYGLASLRLEHDGFIGFLHVGGAPGKSVKLLPGFPREFEHRPAQGFSIQEHRYWFGDITGGSNPEFVYIDQDGFLVIATLDGKTIIRVAAEANAWPIIFKKTPSRSLIMAIAESGMLYATDIDAKIPEGFPKQSGIRRSFAPLRFDYKGRESWLVYDESAMALSGIFVDGSSQIIVGDQAAPILQQPFMQDNLLIFHPRSLEGRVEVWSLDDPSVHLGSWNSGGVGAAGPIFDPQSTAVFATQSGVLHKWNLAYPQGRLEAPGIVLGGQVYNPVVAEGSALFVKTDRGEVLKIDSGKMTVVSRRTFQEFQGESGFFIKHVVGTKPQLFFGNGNLLTALKTDLSIVQGYPVTGSIPEFFDLDGNGSQELLSIGFDGKLYAYSIPGE